MGEEEKREPEFYKNFLDFVWGYLNTKCQHPKMVTLWVTGEDQYMAVFEDAAYVAKVMGGKTMQCGPHPYEYPAYYLSAAEMEELKEKLASKTYTSGLVLMHPINHKNVVDIAGWKIRKPE